MNNDLSHLITEQVNEKTRLLDASSTLEMVQMMNEEDQQVAHAVKEKLPQIAAAIELIYSRLKNEGRLFYIGAGTSGRMGIMDAAECPPTFGTDPTQIQAIIAGGNQALRNAVEDIEDDPLQGESDLKRYQFTDKDILVGIAASGRTPYVAGAITYAQRQQAATVAITCNPGSPIGQQVDLPIEVEVGPEVLLGSTRLKAGTAQKMIINMLSTGVMVLAGKVYQNLMVDLKPLNQKLRDRALRLIQLATGCQSAEAKSALAVSGGEIKTAIVSLITGLSPEQSRQRLAINQGRVRAAIKGQIV